MFYLEIIARKIKYLSSWAVHYLCVVRCVLLPGWASPLSSACISEEYLLCKNISEEPLGGGGVEGGGGMVQRNSRKD